MMWVWFAGQVALMTGAVLLASAHLGRRLAAGMAVAAAFALPLLAPLPALARAVLACMGLLALVKVLQANAMPDRWSLAKRLWHAVAPFDLDKTTRVAPGMDWRLLGMIMIHSAIAAAALWALAARPVADLQWPAVRWLLGVIVAYSGMEVITEAIRLGHLLFGVSVAPIQSVPLLSTSVREFWSKRWNRPVSGWLNRFVFIPVVRTRGLIAGLFAAFLVSGALHGWMFYVAVGLKGAVMATLFFVLQALFVIAESAMAVERWPVLLRRAWTLGLLLASSPLFVLPLLDVLGV